jgi:hypothetical protein
MNWMNIKSVNSKPVFPIEPKPRVDGNTRTKESSDRDANGRGQQGEPELKRHLTQSEFDEAIKALEENPGLKANHLTVRVEVKEDCRVILIVDPNGGIVRRMSETQLWATTRDKDRSTGKFLDKAM